MTTSLSTLDESFARSFAKDWIDAWNAHDLERILEHYDEDVAFTSPFVVAVTGRTDGTLIRKQPLREYFQAALDRYDDLHFTDLIVHVGMDSATLVYTCHVGGTDRRAAETMLLRQGRAVRVLCHYSDAP